MPSGFQHYSGPQVFDNIPKTSAAITAGDSVKYSSGSVLLGTAGAKVHGVTMVTDATTAVTRKQIMLANPVAGRTRFKAWEKRASGALAATDKGLLCDLAGATGAQGFDSSSTSNKDIYLDQILSTGAVNVGSAAIIFADPTFLQY